MSRFILTPIADEPNHWKISDTEKGIEAVFCQRRFADTFRFKFTTEESLIERCNRAMAEIVSDSIFNEMREWLVETRGESFVSMPKHTRPLVFFNDLVRSRQEAFVLRALKDFLFIADENSINIYIFSLKVTETFSGTLQEVIANTIIDGQRASVRLIWDASIVDFLPERMTRIP